jgi:hypothetical protein
MHTKFCLENLKGRVPSEDRHRWEDNRRMDLRKTGCKGVDRSHLDQEGNQWWAPVNMVMNLQVP